MNDVTLQLRLGENKDSPQVIRLITDVYAEYGETMCLDNGDRDLLDIEAAYRGRGGEFWVLEESPVEKIVGCHAAYPLADRNGVCTFRRLYLHAGLRGQGWGYRLMQQAITWARRQGFQRIEFWSDTRFRTAHQFFSRLGFQKTGAVREMHDSIEPYWEYFFFMNLMNLEPGSQDIAAFASQPSPNHPRLG